MLSDLNASFKQYIIKSWDQCTSMSIDPELKRAPSISEEEFSLICQNRKNLLLQISLPIMNKFRTFYDYSKYVIAITDENGTILSTTGDENLKKEGATKRGFDVGTNWSEENAGTNAIGTCLKIAQPICILGEDHYVKDWRDYGCAAAPIRDPFSGEIIGTLDLTCRLEDFHVFSLCIVEILSELVENTLRNVSNTDIYGRQGLIMEYFLSVSKESDIRDGIFAIDLEGNILASNKVIHSIVESDKDMPLKNIFQFYPWLHKTLYKSNELPVSFSTKLHGPFNESSTYLANFIPILDKDSRHEGWIGRLMTISLGDESAENAPIAPIYISSSMSEIINRARKVASFASTKLILGETGVGKEILAKFIHANGSGQPSPLLL